MSLRKALSLTTASLLLIPLGLSKTPSLQLAIWTDLSERARHQPNTGTELRIHLQAPWVFYATYLEGKNTTIHEKIPRYNYKVRKQMEVNFQTTVDKNLFSSGFGLHHTLHGDNYHLFTKLGFGVVKPHAHVIANSDDKQLSEEQYTIPDIHFAETEVGITYRPSPTTSHSIPLFTHVALTGRAYSTQTPITSLPKMSCSAGLGLEI
ncbi:MAG: hypothetical protein OXT67_08915 [Zetaproteobacteria bacterium]|nr:hypothetical protein [Zetaproteobacteria bacterium]